MRAVRGTAVVSHRVDQPPATESRCWLISPPAKSTAEPNSPGEGPGWCRYDPALNHFLCGNVSFLRTPRLLRLSRRSPVLEAGIDRTDPLATASSGANAGRCCMHMWFRSGHVENRRPATLDRVRHYSAQEGIGIADSPSGSRGRRPSNNVYALLYAASLMLYVCERSLSGRKAPEPVRARRRAPTAGAPRALHPAHPDDAW